MSIDVRLRARWVAGAGYRYDVLLDEEVIVDGSRDPEHEAARVLHARGLRGRFRTIDFVTGRPRMILDIRTAAGLTTVERDRGGLRVERHRPLSTDAKAALHAPPVHRGGSSCPSADQTTGGPPEAAGGEGAERGTATLDGDDRSFEAVAAGRVRATPVEVDQGVGDDSEGIDNPRYTVPAPAFVNVDALPVREDA